MARKESYTYLGVRRCKCFRCGKKACTQWRICSTGLWHPVCLFCDIELNWLVLRWARVPGRIALGSKYEREARKEYGHLYTKEKDHGTKD